MGKTSEVEQAVYEYMKLQNRPYSAADVFSNLHKAHGKTAVVKAMESLAAEQKLIEKVYGKSKIYVINQNEYPEVSDADIVKLDQDIVTFTAKYEAAQTELKSAKVGLKASLSSLTNEEAKTQLEKLRSEVSNLKERLDKAKEASHDITEEDRQQILKDHKLYVCHWRKRKRMTTDLMNAVLEGYPKSKKIFIEEVGIETDEDYKVKIPET